MEKMMKKPEVEAVRFEDADVIATSSLRQGGRYWTKGTELNDYGGSGSGYSTDKFYQFTNQSNNATDIGGAAESTDGSYPYAWFDVGGYGWLTNNENYTGNESPNGNSSN